MFQYITNLLQSRNFSKDLLNSSPLFHCTLWQLHLRKYLRTYKETEMLATCPMFTHAHIIICICTFAMSARLFWMCDWFSTYGVNFTYKYEYIYTYIEQKQYFHHTMTRSFVFSCTCWYIFILVVIIFICKWIFICALCVTVTDSKLQNIYTYTYIYVCEWVSQIISFKA